MQGKPCRARYPCAPYTPPRTIIAAGGFARQTGRSRGCRKNRGDGKPIAAKRGALEPTGSRAAAGSGVGPRPGRPGRTVARRTVARRPGMRRPGMRRPGVGRPGMGMLRRRRPGHGAAAIPPDPSHVRAAGIDQQCTTQGNTSCFRGLERPVRAKSAGSALFFGYCNVCFHTSWGDWAGGQAPELAGGGTQKPPGGAVLRAGGGGGGPSGPHGEAIRCV